MRIVLIKSDAFVSQIRKATQLVEDEHTASIHETLRGRARYYCPRGSSDQCAVRPSSPPSCPECCQRSSFRYPMTEPCSRIEIGKRRLRVRLSGRLAINKGGDCESGPDPSISKDGRRVLVRCITMSAKVLATTRRYCSFTQRRLSLPSRFEITIVTNVHLSALSTSMLDDERAGTKFPRAILY